MNRTFDITWRHTYTGGGNKNREIEVVLKISTTYPLRTVHEIQHFVSSTSRKRKRIHWPERQSELNQQTNGLELLEIAALSMSPFLDAWISRRGHMSAVISRPMRWILGVSPRMRLWRVGNIWLRCYWHRATCPQKSPRGFWHMITRVGPQTLRSRRHFRDVWRWVKSSRGWHTVTTVVPRPTRWTLSLSSWFRSWGWTGIVGCGCSCGVHWWVGNDRRICWWRSPRRTR